MTSGARVQTLSGVNKNKIRNVTLVKIDVDGYEIDVLEGGRESAVLLYNTLEERGKSLCDLFWML